MQNRSVSLNILGWGLAFVYGLGTVIFLISYILSFVRPDIIVTSDFFQQRFNSMPLFRQYALIWVLYLPQFIGFIGVLRLREWGRELVILMSIVMCLFFVGRFAFARGADVLAVVSVFINIALIFFFTQPYIKNQFIYSAVPGGKTVLVIDDDRGYLKILRSFLLSRGHETLVAENGEKGIKLAQTRHPDLILLDVIMPGIKGREVCARLKSDEKTRDIPVIFLTAKDSPDDIKAEMELGAMMHITKPFNSKELFKKITDILE